MNQTKRICNHSIQIVLICVVDAQAQAHISTLQTHRKEETVISFQNKKVYL